MNGQYTRYHQAWIGVVHPITPAQNRLINIHDTLGLVYVSYNSQLQYVTGQQMLHCSVSVTAAA